DPAPLCPVEARETLRNPLRKIVELHTRADGPGAAGLPGGTGAAPITDPEQLPTPDPWEIVQLARHTDRPNTLEYISHVFDDYQEFFGDRLFDEDAAIVGGPAQLG